MLWAAAWLYRATNEEYYLKYVIDNAVYMGGTGWAVKEFSWDNKYAGVQILLSKVFFYFNYFLLLKTFYLIGLNFVLQNEINKNGWTQVLLEGKGGAHVSTLKQYKAKADYFACACLKKNDGYDIQTTPG